MTIERFAPRRRCHPARAFTLTEMLVVIMIISILASMVLFAMAGVQQQARAQRTHSQITRLNEMIMERWQSYQTRRVRVRTVRQTSDGRIVTAVQPDRRRGAELRLNGIRELMRLELPDRITDVMDVPKITGPRPALSQAYVNRSSRTWRFLDKATPEERKIAFRHQNAECLYMIVSRIQVGNRNGLEFFTQSEIGDVDGDGMPEILDAWGTPIRLLRWPAGFISPLQDGIPENGRDAFDPTGLVPTNYALYPLIVSAGPDREFDLVFDDEVAVHYSTTDPPNDPYARFGRNNDRLMGTVIDANGDGVDNSLDNIHNHILMAN